MKVSEVKRLLQDAQECKDLEHYMAECGGSLPDDSYYEETDKAVETLTLLYSCKDGIDVKDLIKLHGGSMAEFARDYGIPYRTVQDWASTSKFHHEPPQYLMRLILADLLD